MDFLPLSALLLLLLSYYRVAAGAEMKLFPGTLTVIRGDEARFTCSAGTPEWTVMVWMLNGQLVLTIVGDRVIPSTNLNVTAEKSPASAGDSWVLVLRSTGRHHQGEVSCDLQDIGSKTASLFVQETGSVIIFGGDKLAFKGQSVVFECAAAGWHPVPRLQWHVNGREASEVEYNLSSEEWGQSLFTVTSNLSVTAALSSALDCLASVSALSTPLRSSTRLTVVAEVVQEVADCTVPLALTASLSVFLLLTLLCICTVLCYQQRRQAKVSQQEPIRFDQSVFGRPVAATTGGKVNLGYSTEGPTDAAYTEISTETGRQMDFVSFLKVPDVVSSSSLSLHDEGQAQVCLTEEDSKTIRRITTV